MVDLPNEREFQDVAMARLKQARFTHIDQEALARRDWWGVIAYATTDRYWDCFDQLESLMSDPEYASTVREIWTATNGLQPSDATRRLIDHRRSITPEMWMTAEDLTRYHNLPESVTVFRGCIEGRENGWSWTLNRDSAEHFAHWTHEAHDHRRLLLTGSIGKDRIVAIFTGNWEESEVVTPGDLVSIARVEVV